MKLLRTVVFLYKNYEVEGGLHSRGISTEQFIREMNVRRFM